MYWYFLVILDPFWFVFSLLYFLCIPSVVGRILSVPQDPPVNTRRCVGRWGCLLRDPVSAEGSSAGPGKGAASCRPAQRESEGGPWIAGLQSQNLTDLCSPNAPQLGRGPASRGSAAPIGLVISACWDPASPHPDSWPSEPVRRTYACVQEPRSRWFVVRHYDKDTHLS